MRMFYINKGDPRVFVYRDENGPSGYGVTLNFAHLKARILFVAWLVLCAMPIAWAAVANPGVLKNHPLLIALLTAWPLCLTVGVAVACYCGAARDLKMFPGLKGARDGKGDLWP